MFFNLNPAASRPEFFLRFLQPFCSPAAGDFFIRVFTKEEKEIGYI